MSVPNRAAAVHAAGHAFAYHLHRIPIASVSIVFDPGPAGRCILSLGAVEHLVAICERAGPELDPYFHELTIDDHVVAWYAGPAVESRYTDRPFLECLAEQTESESPIDIVLRLMPDPDRLGAYRRRMQERALALAADPEYRPAIDALADALEHACEIDGATASGILSDAMPDDVPTTADIGTDAIEWLIQEFGRLK